MLACMVLRSSVESKSRCAAQTGRLPCTGGECAGFFHRRWILLRLQANKNAAFNRGGLVVGKQRPKQPMKASDAMTL